MGDWHSLSFPAVQVSWEVYQPGLGFLPVSMLGGMRYSFSFLLFSFFSFGFGFGGFGDGVVCPYLTGARGIW